MADLAADARDRFGGDLWPYGVDANRITLEAFLTYAKSQGVAPSHLTLDDLFPFDLSPAAV